MYRYLEGLSGPKHSPCRAAGILWACRDGETSRKQNPVKCMFSLHAWCTVGPQACGQRGLVGGVAPASVPPSHPSTFPLHETPSTSSPRSPLFPSDAPVTQGNSPAAERGWWWPPWTGPGTCSQPLEALKVQMCAWSPSGQRRQGASPLWEIRGSDR